MNITPPEATEASENDTHAGHSIEDRLAELFHLLAQPARLQILLVIGREEACVCHLESALGLRQAYISQQLMVLRDAGLVITNRDGRNIFYTLANLDILPVIERAAAAMNAGDEAIHLPGPGPLPDCPCPHCIAARQPGFTGEVVC